MIFKEYLISIILFSLTSTLNAGTYISKDWEWSDDADDGYLYAATINSAGRLLGQYCYIESGNCIYMVSINISCEEGEDYPGLINGDSEASHVTLTCGHQYEGQYVYYISGFDAIDALVRDSVRMAIVIPMIGDKFHVQRYSLAGSAYAIDLMRFAAEKLMDTSPLNTDRPAEESI